nr:atherin-like [Aegilops tauschii subsp. strangulata]
MLLLPAPVAPLLTAVARPTFMPPTSARAAARLPLAPHRLLLSLPRFSLRSGAALASLASPGSRRDTASRFLGCNRRAHAHPQLLSPRSAAAGRTHRRPPLPPALALHRPLLLPPTASPLASPSVAAAAAPGATPPRVLASSSRAPPPPLAPQAIPAPAANSGTPPRPCGRCPRARVCPIGRLALHARRPFGLRSRRSLRPLANGTRVHPKTKNK